jgi:hypothetical protein
MEAVSLVGSTHLDSCFSTSTSVEPEWDFTHIPVGSSFWLIKYNIVLWPAHQQQSGIDD